MTVTLKVTEKTKEKMIEYYEDLKRIKTPAYAVFQADDGDSVVTLYESGKCVFQGKDADIASEFWVETEKLNSGFAIVKGEKKHPKETINPNVYYSSSIGSDEVGTGDYFGPIVVTASFVKKEDIDFLEELGVKDSKKLTDDKIDKIAPIIMERIDHESTVLDNIKYNNWQDSGRNLNKIKALLHNEVLYKLKERTKDYDYIIVDQFAEEYAYYNYLTEEKDVVKGITFLTKGEDKSLAVACSSIISRYKFINELFNMSEKVGVLLPTGSQKQADEVAKVIINKYGFDKLREVAKLNFNNTSNLKKAQN